MRSQRMLGTVGNPGLTFRLCTFQVEPHALSLKVGLVSLFILGMINKNKKGRGVVLT